ncbi:MAG: cytochrome c-type biogenesis protein CcmH/NrfF [Myxococcota bacterium]|jgi:cytochrome c-type biogenesis protein CcmH/NrfF
MRIIYLPFTFLLLFLSNSLAFSPENHLSENQEERARELFLQIICPVCAGQTIESSDTKVSSDLRKLVREKIVQGKNNQEIKDEMVQEYGAEILNSPPLNGQNFLLWFLPIIFAILGGAFLLRLRR